MDYFLRNIGKVSRKIKGVDVEEEEISGVLLSCISLYLSLTPSLYIYIYIYIYIYNSLSHSLSTLYLSLSSSLYLKVILKNNGPPISTPYRRRQGPIDMVDLVVCEYFSNVLGVNICHTHRVETNGGGLFVYQPPKGRLPWQM